MIFLFDGQALGHVFGHVGTCHVVTHKIKMKALGKLICLGIKILKIGPKLSKLWPCHGHFGPIFMPTWPERCPKTGSCKLKVE